MKKIKGSDLALMLITLLRHRPLPCPPIYGRAYCEKVMLKAHVHLIASSIDDNDHAEPPLRLRRRRDLGRFRAQKSPSSSAGS
jgi:hypothetical protein